MAADRIVYVITGATSGVGEALAKRLLEESASIENIVLCLACRNLKKANAVKAALLSSHPKATVDTVYLDTSQPRTAIQAGKELKCRYRRIDYLYFNAGIMPVSGINWSVLWPPTPSNYYKLFCQGEDIVEQKDGTTVDGLPLIFTTNVTGHYVLLKELQPFLEQQGRGCHIIWTSSSSSSQYQLLPDDLEDTKSTKPYHVSKRSVDLLSMSLNDQLNSKKIYSDVICPGLVISQMTYGMLPKWAWYCLMPILFLIRVSLTNFYTLWPANGAEAPLWLARRDPSCLNHTHKYCSMSSALGKSYVTTKPMNISTDDTERVVAKLDSVAELFLHPQVS